MRYLPSAASRSAKDLAGRLDAHQHCLPDGKEHVEFPVIDRVDAEKEDLSAVGPSELRRYIGRVIRRRSFTVW